MVKFFRKIRQQLLTENKFSQYFLYAGGEIVLVVIGILIALQVNNCNEDRKDRKTERQIVKTIYEELSENLEYNDSTLQVVKGRFNNTMKLMEYTAKPELSISAKTFDSLMITSFLFPKYTPVKADLERVLGSEQIDLISSPELQEKLSDYKTSIDQAALAYTYAEDDFKLVILPYFVKNYPLKALMLQYGIDVPPSPHERNYKELLGSLEFENVLGVIFADSGGQFGTITENLELIDQLKELIEKEYPAAIVN